MVVVSGLLAGVLAACGGGDATTPSPARPAVALVTVVPTTLTLTSGQSRSLTASVSDASGRSLTDRVVSWSSSATSSVTVDQSGTVTAVDPGTATITATSEGKSASAAVTVTPPPVSVVLVTSARSELLVGTSIRLTVELQAANGAKLSGRAIAWSVDVPSVASVSPDGTLLAVAPGTVRVTASAEGISGSVTVKVIPVPVARVAVALERAAIVVGETVRASALVFDSSGTELRGRDVVWASSASGVASVSATGAVTAIAAGTSQISATVDGRVGSALLTVSPVPVATVVVSPPSATLFVGGTITLAAEARAANGAVLAGRTVTWSSEAPSIATVTASGAVTAIAPGAVRIVARSENASAAVALTVVPIPVARVAVSLDQGTLSVGDAGQATVTVADSLGRVLTGRTVTWSSTSPAVASVSQTGRIATLTSGTTSIVATVEGRSGNAALTVTAPPPLRMGANLISNGNQYLTPEYNDANVSALLTLLVANRFKQISIRVIWAIMEPSPGQYNATAIARLDRIMSEADRLGLDVMLDFHTLFNDYDQFWQAPPWLASIAPAITINGENVPAGSIRHLFYTAPVRDAFSAMQRYVAGQLVAHPSLRFISLMNEPYLNFASTTNETYFAPLLSTLVSRMKGVTSKAVGVRMLPGWNPWSDDARKRIGAGGWTSLDYVAVNVYPDPFNDAQVVDGTAIWPTLIRMRMAARSAGKPFMISEIGTTAASSADRERFWTAMMNTRFPQVQPDVVMPWNVQNDFDFYPAVGDSFNLLRAPSTFAPYVIASILPFVR